VTEPQRVAIELPMLGTVRATFSLWYVRLGERVYEGDRVAEVLIPGATFDVPAQASGLLVERLVFPNDPLISGQVLGVIQEEAS
jgi:pyruvate/2-oxoglutarate dehydrogenase complex dihydrolipoamide acyltransferase (E2) component